MQGLSRVIKEVEAMIGEDGKFERVRVVWEGWWEQVQRIRAEREVGNHGKLSFVEGIGDGWKAEAMVIERELGYLRRDLGNCGVRDDGGKSCLGRLVRGWGELVKGLEEELDLLQWIEGETMVEEQRWVEDIVGGLGKGVSEVIGR